MDTCTYNSISVCSGNGGMDAALRTIIPVRTVCYLENEIAQSAVLARRMADTPPSLDAAPIWSDVKTFNPGPWRGKVDIVTGGFPCQPFSVAGAHRGEDDPRNLWPDVARLVRGIRPPDIFFENVPGILEYYFDKIRPELSSMGYEITEGLFSAEVDAGASHRRQRLFIMAHTIPSGLQGLRRAEQKEPVKTIPSLLFYPPRPHDTRGWSEMLKEMPKNEPTFCRTLNGPSPGLDFRLRSAGNGVVPEVAATAFRTLADRLNILEGT